MPRFRVERSIYSYRSGDLVWSGFTYFSTWTGNFQAARWKGQDVLFAFEGVHNDLHGHGHGIEATINPDSAGVD